MTDIFISYKSERRAAASHLARVLRAYGYDVWFDYGLIAGTGFEGQLEEKLAEARAVVVLWCSMAVQSEWVQREAAAARRAGKFIPSWIEATDLPEGFRDDHTLNLQDWDGAPRSHHLDPLLEEISRLVGRAPSIDFATVREIDRTWRDLGAPSLAQFALGQTLKPGEQAGALGAPTSNSVKWLSGRANWNEKRIPPPREGERWETTSSLIAPQDTWHPPLTSQRFYPRQMRVSVAFWDGDKIRALAETTDANRNEQAILVGPRGGDRLYSITQRPRTLKQGQPDWSKICFFGPAGPHGNGFVFADSRRAGLWMVNEPWGSDQHDALVCQLKPDGTSEWIANKIGHWPEFRAHPSPHPSGDVFHDRGRAMAVSPDGKWLARVRGTFYGAHDSNAEWALEFWEITDPKDPPRGGLHLRHCFKDLKFSLAGAVPLLFSPSSQHLIVLKVLDAFLLEVDQEWQTGGIRQCAPSTCEDGFETFFDKNVVWHPQEDVYVVWQGLPRNGAWTFRLALYAPSDPEPIHLHPVLHTGDIEDIAWSPDGKYIATAGMDETIEIWNLETDTSQTIFCDRRVEKLVFSPDGQRLAVEFQQGSGAVIDPKTTEIIAPLPAGRLVGWNGDAKTIAIAGSKTIGVLNLGNT